MSCWVVPSVAAEFWGVSVEQVLQKAREGGLPVKHDAGWMFVDVAPDSPVFVAPPRELVPPLTYTPITEEERVALIGDCDAMAADDGASVQDEQPQVEAAGPNIPSDASMEEIYASRRQVATRRLGPSDRVRRAA